jgi:acyl-CoA reductase-like NAD-dependent aldehyde dehydrogenase
VHKNYIDGQWVSRLDVPNINPSDIIGRYVQATADDTMNAIAAAKAASRLWGHSPPPARHAVLKQVSDELSARWEELGTLLSREEGKTKAEGIGKIVRASQIFGFYAAEALRTYGKHVAGLRDGVTVDVTREPAGVVGIIAPWNFPMAIPAWKIAPAICYGNCVVFKSADAVPASAWSLADILSRTELPPGVFNLVMGKGSIVGEVIANNPHIDARSFTGSSGIGSRIAENSAKFARRLQLEMGGKNRLVVPDDADLANAVDCAVQGAFYSTGQRCTASSRFIVTDGIHERFVAAVCERLETLTVDHALKPTTDIGPVVNEAQLGQDLDYIDIGVKEGATLAFGGRRLSRDAEGFFLEPTLFVDTSNDMRINREEIFGPVATVIRVRDYDEALAVANDTPFGLTSGICTGSLRHSAHFRRNAQAGMVMVNLPTAGVDYHVPFGGRKASSHGPREQGTEAVEFYTTTKTAYCRA